MTSSVTPAAQATAAGGSASASSAFKSVTACNRCRLRKNRCDQNLPACSPCEKARMKCVGWDPLLKKEVPRSYVFFLEQRVSVLESILRDHSIPFPPAEDFAELPAPKKEDQELSDSLQGQTTPIRPAPRSTFPPTTKPPIELHHGGDSATTSPLPTSSWGTAMSAALQRAVPAPNPPVHVPGRPRRSSLGSSEATVMRDAEGEEAGSDEGEKHDVRGLSGGGSGGASSMRHSVLGLCARGSQRAGGGVRPADFPGEVLGRRLVELYFEHANPQIPILHRAEFEALVGQVFAESNERRGHGGSGVPVDDWVAFLMNIVFAVGSGVIVGRSIYEDDNDAGAPADHSTAPTCPTLSRGDSPPSPKKRKRLQAQSVPPRPLEQPFSPEAYHAASLVHLERHLRASSLQLQEPTAVLQAVLLLAAFALLRPTPPGLWYIVGVAVRLALDLDLHAEDAGSEGSTGANNCSDDEDEEPSRQPHAPSRRAQHLYQRDLRRRLWWCVYSLDRLVATCVGRPVGVPDGVISTPFPAGVDDTWIGLQSGVVSGRARRAENGGASYKRVAHHYFRLRILQSEILQVLCFRRASSARTRRREMRHDKMTERELQNQQRNGHDGSTAWNSADANHHRLHLESVSGSIDSDDDSNLPVLLPCQYLQPFGGKFLHWRQSMEQRLLAWKASAPSQGETGVSFSSLFPELNFWQAIIMLYRNSLSVPAALASELPGGDEREKGSVVVGDGKGGIIGEGEGERVEQRSRGFGAEGGEPEGGSVGEDIFVKVADAGMKVLRIYRQLWRMNLVSYTYLATHHMFIAALSFLYSVWHSPAVRSRLSLEDVDFTLLAATSMLSEIRPLCPPAQSCHDALQRMTRATLRHCRGGFGGQGGQAALGPPAAAAAANITTPRGLGRLDLSVGATGAVGPSGLVMDNMSVTTPSTTFGSASAPDASNAESALGVDIVGDVPELEDTGDAAAAAGAGDAGTDWERELGPGRMAEGVEKGKSADLSAGGAWDTSAGSGVNVPMTMENDDVDDSLFGFAGLGMGWDGSFVAAAAPPPAQGSEGPGWNSDEWGVGGVQVDLFNGFFFGNTF